MGRIASLVDGRSSMSVGVALLTPLIHLSGLPVGFLVWGGPGVIAFAGAVLIALILAVYPLAILLHLLLAAAFRAIARFGIALTLATLVNAACVYAFLALTTLERSGAETVGSCFAIAGQLALSLLAWKQTRGR